ncbi:hypothetical protein GCM10020331_088440 [Ectobacillus funiculus]
MWSVLGVLFVAIVILIIEVPSLWKAKNEKKELWIFSFLLLCSTVLGIAKGLQMDIPNPLDWLAVIFFEPLGYILQGLLKING